MANKITIKNVKELLGPDYVDELIDKFDIKTSKSFTTRDANFISKSIVIIIKHYFYEKKTFISNKFVSLNIEKTTVETDSDNSDNCITIPQHNGLDTINNQNKSNELPNSIDINKLKVILNRISGVGSPRKLYSYFISLINGEINNSIKYILLLPLAKCLRRIELRRSPLIANILASLHTLVNEGITSIIEINYYLSFIDQIWDEPISDDIHGVANSCLKSFSVQLNEKLFYKIYQENDLTFVNSVKRLCHRYIKNEGDVLEWFISLKTIPNACFRGPLESNSNQESILSFTMLDNSYLSSSISHTSNTNEESTSEVILPLVYSHKSRGIMAMHSALAIIKSCTNINDLLYKKCILKLISWANDEFKFCDYKITSLKGTSWQPIEISDTLILWNEKELLSAINDMINGKTAQE
ncbi:hypothetical protein BmR1_04g05830 [Babesia microti strain RI]|uniref:Uncharacterized protein n=1 Tax=Babesia microti (strain RI) TaxID=1133968 RepID=I7I9N8_BABMR|nr:hypothetical protein BmR1_04g05830 [Babesia microti strain RI]CCF75364.1 hypothetical protein BmR1_04g05830 [Babesia microti strain RI]|eukprot:XP_012649772.1 hypothetical protein BmR1_04g05830 [Babesia microti strain RI]